jgi:hypothetical protein
MGLFGLNFVLLLWLRLLVGMGVLSGLVFVCGSFARYAVSALVPLLSPLGDGCPLRPDEPVTLANLAHS